MRRGLSVADLQKGEAYINMDYAVAFHVAFRRSMATCHLLRHHLPMDCQLLGTRQCLWTRFCPSSVAGECYRSRSKNSIFQHIFWSVSKFFFQSHSLHGSDGWGSPRMQVGFVPTWWPSSTKEMTPGLTKTCWMTIGETTTGGKWYPFVCIFFLRQVQKT